MKFILVILLLLPGLAQAGSVVAARTLAAGTIIMPEDVALSQEDNPTGPSQISHVVGQQLRSMVYEGRRIEATALTAPTAVKRNQIVTLAYEKAALRIEAEGRALGAGGIGEVIRVMNSTSRVTVSGRIAADGTVVVEQF